MLEGGYMVLTTVLTITYRNSNTNLLRIELLLFFLFNDYEIYSFDNLALSFENVYVQFSIEA